MSEEREILRYADFGGAVRDLAMTVAESGYRPSVVIAVARGGLIPAGALAYALGTKAAGTLNVEFYSDVEETLPDPVVLEPFLDIGAMRGQRVLVVDDVADSGRTLALVMDLISQHQVEARSAVLYTKPRTIIQPDYSWRDTDRWIIFPWSAEPPLPDSWSAEPPLPDSWSAEPPLPDGWSAEPPLPDGWSAEPPLPGNGERLRPPAAS